MKLEKENEKKKKEKRTEKRAENTKKQNKKNHIVSFTNMNQQARSLTAEPKEPSNMQAEVQAAEPTWLSSHQAKSLRKNQPGIASIRIFTNNCRGYTSKQESVVKYVIKKLQPDVINIEEPLLKNTSRIIIEKYLSFCQNRPEGKRGGGVATLVASSVKSNATKVAQNNQYDEYMVVRLDYVKPALNIVHMYGQVENRVGPENVLEGWTQD